VQHLEGGIVGTILAQNGDVVEQGQPLLEMDNTQPVAQLEIATSQLIRTAGAGSAAASRARQSRRHCLPRLAE
jgi:epimerase transport system membrane fusion protein